jgi:hypothetical protein
VRDVALPMVKKSPRLPRESDRSARAAPEVLPLARFPDQTKPSIPTSTGPATVESICELPLEGREICLSLPFSRPFRRG